MPYAHVIHRYYASGLCVARSPRMCRQRLHVVKSYTSEAHLGGLRQALVPKRNAEEGTGGSRTKTIEETIEETQGDTRGSTLTIYVYTYDL